MFEKAFKDALNEFKWSNKEILLSEEDFYSCIHVQYFERTYDVISSILWPFLQT